MAAKQKCVSHLSWRVTKILVDRDREWWDSSDGPALESLVQVKGLPVTTEKDLIEAFESVVHREFPNPKRIGCPARGALAQLVIHAADPEFAVLLTHIRQCAPCFDELKELRRNAR